MENNDKIQLCQTGDQLYRVTKVFKSDDFYVEPIKITLAEFVGNAFGHWYYRDHKGRSYFNRNIRSSCFKTQEEAEKEIQRRKNIIKKRELLKNYEQILNKELDIGEHCIIK